MTTPATLTAAQKTALLTLRYGCTANVRLDGSYMLPHAEFDHGRIHAATARALVNLKLGQFRTAKNCEGNHPGGCFFRLTPKGRRVAQELGAR